MSLAALMAAGLLLMLGSGCRRGADDGSPSAEGGRRTIGVSLLTMQHQFYQELRAGLEAAARDKDLRLIVVSAEFDSSRQANQIDEFIVQRVDAIVVSPCDSRSVGASIAAANRAAIPVFTADIANLSPMGQVISHIASDNVQGGREAARLLVEALGEKGTVVILSHPEVTSVSDRVRGFKEELQRYPNVRVAAELSADGKRDKAVRVMEDLLQSHPDLSGVFAINDDTALGALAAIEAAGRAAARQTSPAPGDGEVMAKEKQAAGSPGLPPIRIVGYDATPEARARIAAGAIHGDVMQNPARIGELTIQAVHDFLEGRKPPELIPVEVGRFTADSP